MVREILAAPDYVFFQEKVCPMQRFGAGSVYETRSRSHRTGQFSSTQPNPTTHTMKFKITLLSLLAGLLGIANAQDKPAVPGGPGGGGGGPGGPGGGGRGRFQPDAETLKKYDKDGDGKLNDEERTAMRADRDKAMLEKYDADKDGKLNNEERMKMEAENPRRGMGGPPPTAEEIKTYDKNGDGKLEGDEATALREARMKAMTEKYDTDKDGKLSDEERQKMFEDFRKNGGGGRGPRPGGEGDKKPDAPKPDAPKVPLPEGK